MDTTETPGLSGLIGNIEYNLGRLKKQAVLLEQGVQKYEGLPSQVRVLTEQVEDLTLKCQHLTEDNTNLRNELTVQTAANVTLVQENERAASSKQVLNKTIANHLDTIERLQRRVERLVENEHRLIHDLAEARHA